MTDQTAPIRKGLLPSIPPPEWEFHTVYGARTGTDGCALFPGDTGPVVVRRRVTYGDWEPVRPDRWADEPPTAAAAVPAGQAPDTDQTDVEPSDPTECSGDEGFCPEHGFHRHSLKQPGEPEPDTDRAELVEIAAQAIRDSNGTPEALEWWRTHPQLIPAHVYAAAALAVLPALPDRAAVLEEAADEETDVDVVANRAAQVIASMGADIRALTGQRDRYRSAWCSARERAHAYGEGILRHVADRDWWKQQAHAVQAGAEVEHRAAVLLAAADEIDRMDLPQDQADMFDNGARWATKLLRRLAAAPAVVSAVPGQTDSETRGCAQCGHLSCMGKGRRCGVVLTSDERIVDPPCPCTGAEQPAAGAQ